MTISELAGTTWVFRKNLSLGSSNSSREYIWGSDSEAPIFSCNGMDYQLLYVGKNTEGVSFGTATSGTDDRTLVYNTYDMWEDEAYRTITFKNTLSSYSFNGSEANFIRWLRRNAIRQGQKVYKVYEDQIQDIADAIRGVTGGSATLKFPLGFVDALDGYSPSVTSFTQKTATATKTTPSYTDDNYAYDKYVPINNWSHDGAVYFGELTAVEYDGSPVAVDTFTAQFYGNQIKVKCASGKSFTAAKGKVITFTFTFYDIVVQ